MRRGRISWRDRVERGPREIDQDTCVNQGVITAQIKSEREHHDRLDQDPTDGILRVFKTLIFGSDRDCRSRSDGHDLIETVHDGPFHRNRRSF